MERKVLDKEISYQNYCKFARSLKVLDLHFMVEEHGGEIQLEAGKTYRVLSFEEFDYQLSRNAWFSYFIQYFI